MVVPFDAGDAPKIIKIHKFAKMDPRDVPGSKRHLKDIQKAPKKGPKLDPKWIPEMQNVRKLRSQKNDKKPIAGKSSKVPKWDPNGGGHFTPVTLQKSLKFTNLPKWTPGTSQVPKGIQKASKSDPKGIKIS